MPIDKGMIASHHNRGLAIKNEMPEKNDLKP